MKGSQWKIKDKIGNAVKLKLYYCSNSAMKNVENAGTSKKLLYFLVEIHTCIGTEMTEYQITGGI